MRSLLYIAGGLVLALALVGVTPLAGHHRHDNPSHGYCASVIQDTCRIGAVRIPQGVRKAWAQGRHCWIEPDYDGATDNVWLNWYCD